jgi:DNA-binding NtrC family response regulator
MDGSESPGTKVDTGLLLTAARGGTIVESTPSLFASFDQRAGDCVMRDSPQSDPPVLLVDDEEAILTGISNVLTAAGVRPLLTCSDARRVLSIVDEQEIDAILLDLAMPYVRGEVLLGQLRESHPEIPIIIVTASGDLDTAVRCMKVGAFDYMVKAVEPSRLVSGVKRAVEMRRLSRQYSNLKEHLLSGGVANIDAFSKIITTSPRMQAIFRFIESIAPSAETVLITGETGTGKELMAEAVHVVSGRSGALVRVDTAGLDDTIFSDTLFGHARGAFTGAESVRKGLVQQADAGTLFLDEIGDLSPMSQIKLLRLTETHEYYPLGSDLPRATSTRFVVATNRDLADQVSAGQFRRDLYYRLKTHEIRIPPLRERKEDLPVLVDHFLDQASIDLQKKKLTIPPELLLLLSTYDFPGNVRELRSMIYNAVSLQKEKTLSLQTFRNSMGRAEDKSPIAEASGTQAFPDRLPSLKQAVESLIQEALHRSHGNIAIAAGILGISPQALSKRLSRRRKAASQ